MAIGYLNLAIVGRSTGASSVHAAAYASRADLTDERTGVTYRYGDKSRDLVASWVWLPKGAPDHLRDRSALWNAVEKAETRKNSQLARRMIVALPHELTPKQQEQLLKDYVRENFTRKGLAADVSIHRPHDQGDQRNQHAHILIPTRFLDKMGLAKKDRDSNSKETFQAWRADWAKKANYQLERHGHAARVSFDVPDGQEPQVHMGQAATALERKGVVTRVGDMLREIVNDNDQRRSVANDLKPARRQEIVQEPEPFSIDRDAEDAEWQDAVDQAGIDTAEAQRQAFFTAQSAERQDFEQSGRAMAARHSTAWNEVLERYHDSGASYQSGTAEEAAEATSGALSFFLSLFTNIAESVTRSLTGKATQPARATRSQRTPDQKDAERRRQQQQALEALMAEQAQERLAFERRREEMMRRQELARGQFEEPEQKRWGALQTSFDREAGFREALKSEGARKDARQQESSKEKGPQGNGLEPGS